jgi:hypothetical protein
MQDLPDMFLKDRRLRLLPRPAVSDLLCLANSHISQDTRTYLVQ